MAPWSVVHCLHRSWVIFQRVMKSSLVPVLARLAGGSASIPVGNSCMRAMPAASTCAKRRWGAGTEDTSAFMYAVGGVLASRRMLILPSRCLRF